MVDLEEANLSFGHVEECVKEGRHSFTSVHVENSHGVVEDIVTRISRVTAEAKRAWRRSSVRCAVLTREVSCRQNRNKLCDVPTLLQAPQIATFIL
jgi:hypothetical protein